MFDFIVRNQVVNKMQTVYLAGALIFLVLSEETWCLVHCVFIELSGCHHRTGASIGTAVVLNLTAGITLEQLTHW